MKDYAKGKIYRLISEQTDECYVGSTIQTLAQRMTVHRYDFKKKKGNKQSFKVLCYDDVKIILLENYACRNSEELRMREQYWIEKLSSTTNVKRAYSTRETKLADNKNYYQQNKERILEAKKIYAKTHQAEIRKRQSQRIVCDSCNISILKYWMPRHIQSKNHQNQLSKTISSNNNS